jgi:Protein of unknown function (DUF1592)/Protein of unknown function (DUF1595)/Protein of unknown function (DUF1588)/Protein of unknown function (DUF1585)
MKARVLHGVWVGCAVFALGACTGQIGRDPSEGLGPATGGSTTTGPGTTTGMPDAGGTGPWQPAPCVPSETAFAKGRIWQITDQQYVNSVADVLGIRLTGTDADVSGAANSTGEFTNLSDTSAAFTDMQAQNYQRAAEKVASFAVTAPSMNRLLGTTGATPTPTAAQIQGFIQTKVARLWRRPITSGEVATLTTNYTNASSAADGGPSHGFDLLIQTVLQAPSFLFRTELGESATPPNAPYTISPYEMAAALSFLFTDTAPDETLWGNAVSGALASPDVVAAEVDRLMATPAARDVLTRYLSYWLWVERVRARDRALTLFPEATSSLREAVYQSGFAFLKDVMTAGTLSDLFTSNKVYVNAEMSAVYGIAGGTSGDLVAVATTTPERSSGILTQPALLWATNKRPAVLDPIRHGLFVLEDLLQGADIGPVGSPPEIAKDIAAKMFGNERQLSEQRAMVALCRACHANFDPFGLTRYRYDAIGRYDANKYVLEDRMAMPATYTWATSPTPLDASADVPDQVGHDLKGHVDGALDLAQRLNSDGPRRRVAYAAARRLTMYAMGHDATFENSCALQKVTEHFYQVGSFATFFRELVTSPGFATRDPGD